jgi:hypothetical protein
MNTHVSISYEETLKAKARDVRRRLFGKPKVVNITQEQPPEQPQVLLLTHSQPAFEMPPRFNTSKRYTLTWEGDHWIEVTFDRNMTQIAIDVLRGFPNVTLSEIKGAHRTRNIVFPRHLTTYMIHLERPDISYPRLGKFMGGRDHTSILFAVEKIKAMVDAGTLDDEIASWHKLYNKKRSP